MADKEEKPDLTEAQVKRIKKNRQKAEVLKQARLLSHPYAKGETAVATKTTVNIGATSYKDTGGGFFIKDIKDLQSENFKEIAEDRVVSSSYPVCEECRIGFSISYLYNTFDYPVCDCCRDEEKHNLITKSQAMKEYLLSECDLDKREPPLKFITRKNPYNAKWGVMKLYLLIQVEKRALEVWGSEENLQEELEKRSNKKVIATAKKYQKEMKKLRMEVRSSLYDKTTTSSHIHAFGPEKFNENTDDYTRICSTCGFIETYEKI